MPITTQSMYLSPNRWDDLPVPHPLSRTTLVRDSSRGCPRRMMKSNASSNASSLCFAMGFDSQNLGRVRMCLWTNLCNVAASVGGHISSLMVCWENVPSADCLLSRCDERIPPRLRLRSSSVSPGNEWCNLVEASRRMFALVLAVHAINAGTAIR